MDFKYIKDYHCPVCKDGPMHAMGDGIYFCLNDDCARHFTIKEMENHEVQG